MKLISKIIDIYKNDCWNKLVQMGEGGTVFHEDWYLLLHGVKKALVITSDNNIVAGFPLFEDSKTKSIVQSTKVIPYSSPIFCFNESSKRKRMLIKRDILNLLIFELQRMYEKICFSTSIEITDIVPFIQAGFVPEVRYTYIVDLKRGVSNVLENASSGRRRDFIKSLTEQIEVRIDNELLLFDISEATKWAGDIETKNRTRNIILNATRLNKGVVLVAINKNSDVIGGLFLIWDNKRSYATLSYYNTGYRYCGIDTRLCLEAMKYTNEILNLYNLDFEGSVLKGIEQYFQSYGANQTIYFNMHWDISRLDFAAEDIYIYD